MAKKIKDLDPDFDLTKVKIKVPNTAIQVIKNTETPIVEGYLLMFMDENRGLYMSHEESGKKNGRMIEVYPEKGINEFMEWEVIEEQE